MCHYLVFADKILLCQKKTFFLCQKKNNKKFLYGKVASHILCPSFVCKLLHECEDITKNAWRTPLNAQCNIKYRLQYSLFLTFLNYHQNRLFLYFLVNYRVSIMSLLFWVSIPNPGRGLSLRLGFRARGLGLGPNPN